jgi:hypothetical protein
MDVIVARWMKCGTQCTIQDTFTESFTDFDMASLRTTVYIGYASINYYSGRGHFHNKHNKFGQRKRRSDVGVSSFK